MVFFQKIYSFLFQFKNSKAILLFSPFILCACSSSFWNGNHLKIEEKKQISTDSLILKMNINGTEILPANELKQLYAQTINKNSCKEGKLNISIDGQVQSIKESAWYIGMALMIPFWPAMPSKTKLLYTLNASLYCNENLYSQITLQEEEEIHLFFYGAIRTAPIQEASDLIHYKFAARLKSALHENKPVDSSIFTDYQF